MIKNYIDANLRDGEDVIKEFDSDCDGTLNFEEFCMLVLPSASPSLRYSAETRKDSCYYRCDEPLKYEVISRLVQVLQKEMDLQRNRQDQRRQLVSDPDFLKHKTFDDIARGCRNISMADLTIWAERNGYFMRSEDVEAILRRLDHDADRMISFEEYAELVNDAESGSEKSEQKLEENKKLEDSLEREENPEKKEKTPAKTQKKSAEKQKSKSPDTSADKKKREEAQKAAQKEREDLEKQIEEEKARIKKEREEAETKREQERKEREERIKKEQEEREARLKKEREEYEARKKKEAEERDQRLKELQEQMEAERQQKEQEEKDR